MSNPHALYGLIALFSIGSWVDINGIWVELPVLVNVLPEGWYLPSYITIVIQLANIGPLLYALVRAHVQVPTIYKFVDPLCSQLVLIIGALSCALLVAFWDTTAWIFGAEHSVAFLALLFIIGLTDCTSSVAFLSYISRFPSRYVTAYYVGAGASGLIPSVLAFIQGASLITCPPPRNSSNSTESYEAAPAVNYLFSVDIFFAILTGILLVAVTAFGLVHYKYGRRANPDVESDARASALGDAERVDANSQAERGTDLEARLLRYSEKCYSQAQWVLFILTMSCSFLLNGFMPSLQTFSVLPYGQMAYYITVCLNSLVQPLGSFLALFLPLRKVSYCVGLTIVAWISAILLVSFALMSPPPLHDSIGGVILICGLWIILTATISYLRPILAMLVSGRMSKSGLFWCGVLTQIGACGGALLSFLLVNVLQVFKQVDMCS